MNNESRIEANESTNQAERIDGNASGEASRQPANAAPVPPTATPDSTASAKHR